MELQQHGLDSKQNRITIQDKREGVDLKVISFPASIGISDSSCLDGWKPVRFLGLGRRPSTYPLNPVSPS